MNNISRWWVTAMAILIRWKCALFLSGIFLPDGASGEVYKIGLIYDQITTEFPDQENVMELAGLELWAESVNARGGILFNDGSVGTIEVVFEEVAIPDGATAEETQAIFKVGLLKLFDAGVKAVKGSSRAKPMILHECTSRQIFVLPVSGSTSVCDGERDAWGNDVQYEVCAELVSSEYARGSIAQAALSGYKTAAVVYWSENAWANAMAPIQKDMIENTYKMDVVLYQGYANGGKSFDATYDAKYGDTNEIELERLAGMVVDARPELLVIWGYMEGVTLLKYMREIDWTWTPKITFLTVAPTFPEWHTYAGEVGNYITTPTQWSPAMNYKDPVWGTNAEFSRQFTERTGRDPTYQMAMPVAGMMAILLAMEQANSYDNVVIKDFLLEVSEETFFGPMRFTSGHRNIGRGPVTLQWQDSELLVVLPQAAAQKTMVTEAPSFYCRVENCVAGFSVVEDHMFANENAAPQLYHVAIDSLPGADVTVTFELSQAQQEVLEIHPTSLTFTKQDWDQPKTFQVRAVNDNVDRRAAIQSDEGSVIRPNTVHFVRHTTDSEDPSYVGLVDGLVVQLNEDDNAGVAIPTAVLEVSTRDEAAGVSYDVVLTSQPLEGEVVTVDVLASAQPIIVSQPAQLTFDASNWDVPQSVVVKPGALDRSLYTEGDTLSELIQHDAHTQGGSGAFTLSPVQTLQVTLTIEEFILPCGEVGCGDYASCGGDGVHCACKSGYEMVEGVTASMADMSRFHCQMSLASTGEQRIFWGISLMTNLLSFVGINVTMYQYATNRVMRDPVMLSYLAMFLPDAIMVLLYLPFHASNMLRGEEIDAGSCEVIAFFTYGVVIATYAGPVIVSLVTYKKFVKLLKENSQVAKPFTTNELIWMLACPWALGFILAALSASQGLLGSYRGLICYATRYDHFLTGGMTFLMLLASTALTALFYFKTHMLVKDSLKSNNSSLRSTGVLRRGAKLVLALLVTWLLFAVTGMLSLLQLPPPMWMEALGGILISLQPLVDTYMIMTTKTVWRSAIRIAHTKASKGTTLGGTGRSTENDESGHESRRSTARSTGGKKKKKTVATTVVVTPAPALNGTTEGGGEGETVVTNFD